MIDLPKSRFSVARDGARLLVQIPPKRNYFLLAFLIMWLCGWTFGGLAAGSELLGKQTPVSGKLFLVIWMCGWALGEAFALSVLLWAIIGRETVRLDGEALRIGWRLGSFQREHAYDLCEVKELRVLGAPNMFDSTQMFAFWGLGGGTIGFDYGAKTYCFGRAMDEAEAKMLIRELQGAESRLASRAV